MKDAIQDFLRGTTGSPEGAGFNPPPISVLLVEDNPVEAHLLKAALSKASHQAQPFGEMYVIWLSLLSAAIERILKEPVDVVLLDLTLPDSVGLATLKKLREQALSLPIVVLTSIDDESLAMEALQMGAQDYLVKGQSSGRDVIRAVRYAVERHRLQQNLSLIDELTRLYNRRGFMMLAQQHLKSLSRTNDESVLFFADMDGLKKINDEYGHQVGSDALVLIAEAMKSTFRDSDIVARLGGDEFVAIAMHAHDEDIGVIIARLQEHLEHVNTRRICPYSLSLSIGAVRLSPARGQSLEQFMAEADAAMYLHKQSKRASREGVPGRRKNP